MEQIDILFCNKNKNNKMYISAYYIICNVDLISEFE